MGYAGGSRSNPTYHSLGDHTETVQIDFDPERISYGELLNVFWKSHDPTYPPRSRQYMAAVFFHDEEQKRLALETRDRESRRTNREILTEILPYTGFYLAEDYHQKFRLQQYGDILQELRSIYPQTNDFINSTAAARLNGYLGGYGTPENLEKEIPSLGLSEAGKKRLLRILSDSRPAFRSCPL